MKKMLLLFMILDFVFVGLVLTISSGRNNRTMASDEEANNDQTSGLTTGQKNKWDLVKTFQFNTDAEKIQFTTDKLQMICDTSSLIELRFSAQNVAIAGAQPTISHTFSCDEIKKDQTQTTLITRIADIKNLRTQKILKLNGSEIRASQIYSDEELPNQWRLTSITITGPNTFTVNEHEIEKTLLKNFDFDLTSVK